MTTAITWVLSTLIPLAAAMCWLWPTLRKSWPTLGLHDQVIEDAKQRDENHGYHRHLPDVHQPAVGGDGIQAEAGQTRQQSHLDDKGNQAALLTALSPHQVITTTRASTSRDTTRTAHMKGTRKILSRA